MKIKRDEEAVSLYSATYQLKKRAKFRFDENTMIWLFDSEPRSD